MRYEKEILPILEKKLETLLNLNEYLASNPEISGKEYKSSRKIVEVLREEGFNVVENFSGISTSFYARKSKKVFEKKVALLIEYDALPKIGHACGHCVSATIGLLAGMVLSEYEDVLKVNIDIIGTPSEETDGSKVDMVKKGVFDDYSLAMMIHLDDKNEIRPLTLALDSIKYTFNGKAAHGASAPWLGKNAFNSVQLMFHAIDMLRQHVKPDVRIHGIMRETGDAPNIVPDLCSAEIYIRSQEREYLNEVVRLVDNCAEGASIATGTTWKKEYTANSFDNIKENKAGEKLLKEIYEELGLPVDDKEQELFGSTDLGNVSMVCPSFHSTLQLAPRGTPIHSVEFEKYVRGESAKNAIETGSKIIIKFILRVFGNEEKYKDIFKDFIG